MSKRLDETFRWIAAFSPAAAGVGFLFADFTNLWLRMGLAAFLCGWPLRMTAFRAIERMQVEARVAFQPMGWAYACSGCLCGIGSMVLGGPFGLFGIFFSLRVGLTGVWMLRQ